MKAKVHSCVKFGNVCEHKTINVDLLCYFYNMVFNSVLYFRSYVKTFSDNSIYSNLYTGHPCDKVQCLL